MYFFGGEAPKKRERDITTADISKTWQVTLKQPILLILGWTAPLILWHVSLINPLVIKTIMFVHSSCTRCYQTHGVTGVPQKMPETLFCLRYSTIALLFVKASGNLTKIILFKLIIVCLWKGVLSQTAAASSNNGTAFLVWLFSKPIIDFFHWPRFHEMSRFHLIYRLSPANSSPPCCSTTRNALRL